MLYYLMNSPIYEAFCLAATAIAVAFYAVRWATLKLWYKVFRKTPYGESMWD